MDNGSYIAPKYTAGQFIGIFFLWREIKVLLTAKWIVLAVIDIETYGPNFCQWMSRCIRGYGGKSAEGVSGVRLTHIPSFETGPSGLDFAKFRQYHAI